MRWSGVTVNEWRNEQFWVIGGVSTHFLAVFSRMFKVLGGVNTYFIVTSKAYDKENSDMFALKWTTLLIIPTILLTLNIIVGVVEVSYVINNGFESWWPLLGKQKLKEKRVRVLLA